MSELRRLNWGCGNCVEPGWINSDVKDAPGVDICCDIRDGLPLPDWSIDYTVSIHALPELPYGKLVPALQELRRVLKPGGVLRLGLPDLNKGIDAYRRGDRSYFLVPDEHARSLGAKFVVHMIWYGHSRSLFTHDLIAELLETAGYGDITHCGFRETKSSFADIVTLDNRPAESLFVEASNPGGDT
jgi:predicted SAM-dependent methyltransferase